jgi:hypothetical protein
MTRRLFAGSCCTTPSAMALWAAAFVLLYGAALLLASVWPALGLYSDTLILAALGTACFINFSRNRTLTRRIDDIDSRIKELRSFRRTLHEHLVACEQALAAATERECPTIEALDRTKRASKIDEAQ